MVNYDLVSMSKMSRKSSYIFLTILTAVFVVSIAALVIASVTLNKIAKDAGQGEPVPGAVTQSPAPSHSTEPGPVLDWWKWTPIYQVYPRSFQDTDGDGMGDLKGIKQRIGYVHDLGIKAVWLSPIYESPMADLGYDVSNFTAISPIFGTMDDFQELLDEVHKHGMYLIMDFVPNHSSDQHPWFQKSLRGEKPYDDYYVWRDEPNNWISVFGNSSWEYVPSRGKYYLHQFLVQQPDLNYRNPDLRQEMINVLRFWADLGVDGFRADSVIYLVEDTEFRNESASGVDVPENNHEYLYHNYTENLPETFQVLHEWTKFLRDYGSIQNRHILSCTEAYTDINHVMEFYDARVDIAFNFNLIYWDRFTTASKLREMISTWMDHMPVASWPNWVMSNHDNHRVATRLGGRQYIDIANMLIMLLPGTPTYYNGDEIGMVDGNISYGDTVDQSACKWGPDGFTNFTRDPERTPMQWNTSPNAGFTSATPWLPMADDWQTYNVEKESNGTNSHLSIFKALVQLRQEHVFTLPTNLRLIDVGDENVFAFARESEESRYLIILNIGNDGKESTIGRGLAIGMGKVVIRSANGWIPVTETIDFTRPFSISNAQGYVIELV